MDSQYWVLIFDNVTTNIEDLLTDYLFEQGACGVQENLQFTQLDRKYKPQILEQETKSLIVYFEQPLSDVVKEEIQLRYPGIHISEKKEKNRDWLKEWKEQWKPFLLTDNLWIVPDWHRDDFDINDRRVIYIEPGMAFGTGTHETTQIASQLIVDLLKETSITSALDVGTGSGILSILLERYGVEALYAYDNDEESKRVFDENLERNNCHTIHWWEAWSQELSSQVDLTVANIIDGVLLDLKSQFQKMKSPYYIFTGILVERENLFLKEMLEGWELKTLSRLQKGEWVGFTFEALP